MITNNLSLESFLSNSTKSAVVDPTENQAAKASVPAAAETSKLDPAVNLDLSDAAKKILQQLQAQQLAKKDEPEFKPPFTMSNADKEKITDIIKSFKDDPITKETFLAMETALKDAGFASDKLAVMDSARSFKSTSFLASILAGNNDAVVPNFSQNMAKMQSRQTEYLQSVYEYWQATTNATPEENTEIM